MREKSAIILAAGDGKRMKSKYPKAMCEVLFVPMISWVLNWCNKSGINNICVVVGKDKEVIEGILPEGVEVVEQKERLGTGHAVMMAEDFIEKHVNDDIIVLYADAPFIDDKTILASLQQHREQHAQMTIISAQVDNPFGYGRIVRKSGMVKAIVEEKDADDSIRNIKEINSGTYWFRGDFLRNSLKRIDCNNAQKEYYITDAAKIAGKMGKLVTAYKAKDKNVVLGANDRKGLLALNKIAKEMVIGKLLDEGVELVSDDGVVIGWDVKIGRDTKILPGTIIKGSVSIGEDCVIGPNTLIEDSVIGNGCTINSSQIYSSTVGNEVRIGPNSHLRPNSKVGDRVKIGNFVEIKNSTLGEKTSVAHLTYIGDSDVGKRCNFGCGSVMVNYDGHKKFRTTVGDDVFIGCNSNLVAPVVVEDGAYTAAGSTITNNVEKDALAIARARQVNKAGWAKGFHDSYKLKK